MSTISSNIRLSEDQVDTEAEVELISLITEKLPHYKLRVDYSVRFAGYQHSDFNLAEKVTEEITELTNDQIHQTLEYFILCGLRVNQMTETYEDCAALTLLVQEQRSHLDLAANIGLNLVEKNTQLEQRVVCLEEQLDASKETIKQMTHQLSLKDDLLRMFHSEIENSEEQINSHAEASDNVFLLGKVNVKQLETKLNRLEEENLKLRDQQHTITNHTDLLESKETQLITDCVNHLLESTKTVDRLSVELNKKTNDYLNQHEEISRLLTSKIDLENKTHNLLTENDNLITQLRDHQTKQFTLTKEVSEMRDRYDECINLLNEKQDEIRQLKKTIHKNNMKQVQYYSPSSHEQDYGRSLAMELEESSKRGADDIDHCRTMRIMEQARSFNTSSMYGDDETSSGFTDDLSSSMMNTESEPLGIEQSSGNFLLRRSIQDDCERRRMLRSHETKNKTDHHSISGTLTPRSNAHLPESRYISEALYHRKNSCTGFSSINSNIISRNESPTSQPSLYKYPDKLQLMKPIEGSQTLRLWQNLATPSLTKSLFEDQPQGVCFRGQQFKDHSPESSPNSDASQERNERSVHVSSDFDDIDYEEPTPIVRAKESESHSNTCTYSNSRISHQSNDVISETRAHVSRSSSVHSAFTLNTSVDHRIHHNNDSACFHSSDNNENTPVNDTNLESSLASGHCNRSLVAASSSWLDRFTVGSIMTSIIGYSRPISSTSYTPSSIPLSAASTLTAHSVSESSLIGRLTNLPPLAMRKPPQRNQSGLNLLTSLAPSSSIKTAIYRAFSTEIVEESSDTLGQVD